MSFAADGGALEDVPGGFEEKLEEKAVVAEAQVQYAYTVLDAHARMPGGVVLPCYSPSGVTASGQPRGMFCP